LQTNVAIIATSVVAIDLKNHNIAAINVVANWNIKLGSI